jgi:hypothetical protein
LQAAQQDRYDPARDKSILRPCSGQAGGVFSEYLGSVEFYLWFSADEELAVDRYKSKSLANKQQ